MNTPGNEEHRFKPLSDLMLFNYKEIEKNYCEKINVTGLPSGFKDLDGLTLGFQRGELIVLAGQPGMGKTLFLMNVIRNLSVRNKRKPSVAIFSLEKSAFDYGMYMLSIESSVPTNKMKTGKMSAKDWRNLASASGILAEAPICIDDTTLISIDELCSRCVYLKEKGLLDLVVIDSLQLMKVYRKSKSPRKNRVKVLYSLKELAKGLNVPVIVSLGINSFPNDRENMRPELRDLPGAAEIEHYADLIMFIYRPELHHRLSENEGATDIIVARQLNGPSGVIRLAFQPEALLFKSIKSHCP